MGKSLQEMWEKLQFETKSKKEAELLKEKELFEIREKLRQQYLDRNRIYEKVALSSPSPSSSAAGGGSLTTSTIVDSTYWALIFSPDSDGDSFIPQSMDADADGNVYVASVYISNSQKSIVRKISPTGDVLWEKVLLNSGAANMEVSRVMVAPGGVIILYKGAIRFLDGDGNLQWSFLQDAASPVEFGACCLNTPADDETFYVFGVSNDSGNVLFQIAEFATFFGTRIRNKEISVVGSNEYRSQANMVLNSSGNIIIGLSWTNSPPDYHTTIVEIEPLSSGFNVLNKLDIDPTEYNGYSQDITALAIDTNGNVITHGNSGGITLIPSDFALSAALTLDTVLGSQAWDSTSLAIPNGSSGDVFVVGDDGPNVIKIVKLSSFVPQFSYTIESLSEKSLQIEGWYSYNANSSVKIVDGSMLITASYDDGSPKELLLKLPLTNMSGYPDTASRTYGDFVFTNSPIVQNSSLPNSPSVNISGGDSTWLSNDATLQSGFSTPNNNQTKTKTSLV